MARRGNRFGLAAAVLLVGTASAAAENGKVDSIADISRHLQTCWKQPANARPIDITVIVSFNRAGNIMGHPRISYESADASDEDRLQYRVAVMETLQRCTPLPFTDAMAGAAAGRPFAIPIRRPKTSPPTQERRA